MDPLEVRHLAQVLPGVVWCDAVVSERHSQQLVHQHRPAAVVDLDVLHPPGLGQLDQRHSLQHPLGVLTEKRRVGRLTLAPAGAPHPLQKRAHRVRRLGLEHAVEVAHVDAQLQRGGAHDAGVRALVELLLGQRPLIAGDGAVVDEDRGPCAAHLLGHGLGHGARLAEEQALRSLGDLGGVLGQAGQVRPPHHQQLLAARLLGRVDDRALTPRGALKPGEDRLRVAHRGAQPDPLDIVAGEPGDALENAHQVGPAVGTRHGMDLVDDHHAQVREDLRRVDPL